jgi:hypothetical protein
MVKLLEGTRKRYRGWSYWNDFPNDNLESGFWKRILKDALSISMHSYGFFIDAILSSTHWWSHYHFTCRWKIIAIHFIHATHNAIVCRNPIQKLRVKLFESVVFGTVRGAKFIIRLRSSDPRSSLVHIPLSPTEATRYCSWSYFPGSKSSVFTNSIKIEPNFWTFLQQFVFSSKQLPRLKLEHTSICATRASSPVLFLSSLSLFSFGSSNLWIQVRDELLADMLGNR